MSDILKCDICQQPVSFTEFARRQEMTFHVGCMFSQWQGQQEQIERLQRTLDRQVELFEDYRESFGLDDARFPDEQPQDRQCEYERRFCALLCEYFGHHIGPDQCGKPEHDLCYRCQMRRTEIEAKEAGSE